MSAGSGGYGAAWRNMLMALASSDGRPLDLNIPTSTSEPSRAMMNRMTTEPDSVETFLTNCWCCDSFWATRQR